MANDECRQHNTVFPKNDGNGSRCTISMERHVYAIWWPLHILPRIQRRLPQGNGCRQRDDSQLHLSFTGAMVDMTPPDSVATSPVNLRLGYKQRNNGLHLYDECQQYRHIPGELFERQYRWCKTYSGLTATFTPVSAYPLHVHGNDNTG
ncbi:MAG: hypothetical protein HS132_06860 [Planctomycetia bacterium]|nr:hypothetical protein [Planctomycetia bacterium]